MDKSKTKQQLLLDNEELRTRLEEAEETLRAIRSGEVDALVVSGTQGDQIYTLQGADRSYRILFETMEEGAATLSNDGTILNCNRRLATMLGTPLEKVIGSSLEKYLSLKEWQIIQNTFKKGEGFTGREEFHIKTANGALLPTLFSFSSIQVGDMRGICITATDLTAQKRGEEALRTAHAELEERVKERTKELSKEIEDRKRVEEALRESQALLHAVMENTSDPVYVKDRQSRILMCNPALEKVAGKPVAEIIGKTDSEYYDDPVIGQALRENDMRVMESGCSQIMEETAKTPNGYRIFLSSKAPYRNESGDIIGIIGISHDITERKQAEEALRESEEKHRLLVEHAPAGIYEVDFTTGRFMEVNDAMCQILGYARDELLAMTPFDILDGEGRALFASRIRRARSGERPDEAAEYLVRTKDGRLIWALLNVTFRWNGGKIVGATVVAHDITERKHVEEALRASEMRFRSVLDNSRDVIYRLNVQTGRYEYVSPSAETVVGFSPDAIMALNVETALAMIHPDDLPAMRAGLARLEDTGKGELEYRQRTNNGDYRWISNHMSLIRDHSGRPLYRDGNIRDITERKRMEEEVRRSRDELEIKVQERTAELARANKELREEIERREKAEQQLLQSQKLESMGTLTGGIAHDFNNILATIVINSEMSLLDLTDGSDVRNKIELILQSGLRGKDLVRQMLLFSRKSEKKEETIALTPIIKETFKLLRSSLPTTIQMELHLKTESDTVYADPSQIQQVIMNLCTNAAYAMRGKMGSIDISLQAVTFRANNLPDLDMQPGDYLALSVKDTGSGMDEEVKKRIFEPFFTTKPAGEGTGLGLSVVYGIVKSHKGSITVYSKTGKGSIFRVYLPKANDTGVSVQTEKLGPIPRGNERILFIDDEEIMVTSVQSMLLHLGYKVTALKDSQEALKLFSADPSKYDLVITDQTMPFMTGEDLGKECLRLRPDIPIILCTGYSDFISSEKATAMGFRGFIMKPFTVREGAELVRQVLDQKRPE